MTYENYQERKTTLIQGEPYLSIIIPVYNEAKRIIPTITAISSCIADTGLNWELIISDDGSCDESIALIEELKFTNLSVIRASQDEEKESTIQRAKLAARGRYILLIDADNLTPAEEVGRLLKTLMNEHYEAALSSHAVATAQEAPRSFFRRLLSGGLPTIVKDGLRFNGHDTHRSPKIYTHETTQHLHTARTLKGFSFDLEPLYLASKLGYKIAEIPVQCVEPPSSQVNVPKEAHRFIQNHTKIKVNSLPIALTKSSKVAYNMYR